MINKIEDFIKFEARRALNKYGISSNYLACKYLVTAMPLVIEKLNSNEKIFLQDLYKDIARCHKTTANKVQYAIRYLCDFTDIGRKMKLNNITNGILITKLAMTLIEKYSL